MGIQQHSCDTYAYVRDTAETISVALCDQWSRVSDYWDHIGMTFGVLQGFHEAETHEVPNSWDSVHFISWVSVLAFILGLRLRKLNKKAWNDV